MYSLKDLRLFVSMSVETMEFIMSYMTVLE